MVLSAPSVCRDYDRRGAVKSKLVTPYKPTLGAPSKRAGRGGGREEQSKGFHTSHTHTYRADAERPPPSASPTPMSCTRTHSVTRSCLKTQIASLPRVFQTSRTRIRVYGWHLCGGRGSGAQSLRVALVWGQRYCGLRCSHVARNKLSLSLSRARALSLPLSLSVATLPAINSLSLSLSL
jgi:hypothetical protein